MRQLIALTASFSAFVFALFLPLLLFAQETLPPPETLPEVPNVDFLQFLIQSLGGLKGAGTLAIVGVVVQVVIKFLSTPWSGELFKKLTGAKKLLIVTGLSLVGGVVGLMLPPTSLTLGAALVHSTTMTAFMVFANQAYKQLVEKKT